MRPRTEGLREMLRGGLHGAAGAREAQRALSLRISRSEGLRARAMVEAGSCPEGRLPWTLERDESDTGGGAGPPRELGFSPVSNGRVMGKIARFYSLHNHVTHGVAISVLARQRHRELLTPWFTPDCPPRGSARLTLGAAPPVQASRRTGRDLSHLRCPCCLLGVHIRRTLGSGDGAGN